MEKRLPVALRALARFKTAKKERGELMVACAWAFGETRRIKRTETRRDAWVIVMIACTILPCSPYSVLSESNKCEKGTLDERRLNDVRQETTDRQ